ncbi:hypothetical protein [Acetomicrobium sp. UBA5826]|uniref:hypothetical protein n=1 Tax=Acetomicrobium sp. UBA5826 TaxID=1946039 RepID=UPI00257CEEC6|nr:hypothetical protein [Acetomicrobium sp. UBA5826]
MVEQKNKKHNWGCSIVVIILLVSVFAFAGFKTNENSTNAPSQSAQPAHENKADKTEAIIMAEEFVKDRLVSPSSAKFPWRSSETTAVKVDEDTWVISSYVDSQNKFGAMLRTYYIAKVKYLGNDKWQLLDLEFYEK